ncbi:MAG: methyltransferase [Pseudomonadota bacterium]
MSANAAPLKPDTINTHVNNVYPALAMLAGMQLEVFTVVGEGATTAEQAAAELGVDATKLRALLYALVTAGLMSIEGGKFSNTAESREFLVKGKKRYIGGAHSAYSDLWSSTMRTADSIRSGQPQAKHDFASMSHAELRGFVLGMDASAGAAARRLHKEFDMSRFAHVLDAGGGSGGIAISLTKTCPALRATVAELANVAAITRECVAASDVAERINVIDADFVARPPEGQYDAVIVRSVLQVMGASDAAQTVHNLAATLKPGGEFFAFGRMLDDSRLTPLDAVAVNVMFLNVYENGQAYTESEYRGWLREAGLTNIVRKPISGGYSIMSARRAS